MRRAPQVTVAVVGGSLIAAGPMLATWFSGHRDSDPLGVIAFGSILLSSFFVGFQLRGLPHWLTWVSASLAWVALSTTAWVLSAPAAPLSRVALNQLLTVATLGVLSLRPEHGLAFPHLPYVWLLAILPARLAQEFFEGWLGPERPGKAAEAK